MHSFSIIVASYNTKKHFIKTLNSIKKQTYKKYEIIVIDGFSTDGTVDLIKKNINKKIRFLIEKDSGIYDAMNKGIKLAKGNWTIFMNSGDIFYSKHVLEKLAKICLNNKNYKIVFGDTMVSNGIFNYKVKSEYFNNKTILMPFCHQSSAVSSNLLKKNLFNLKYTLSSDFNFFSLCYQNNFEFKKCNLIISKIISGGQSDINRQKVLTENIKIFYIKKSYLKILFLLCLKIFELFKTVIKSILPNNLIKYILKVKYHKL